MTSGLKFEEEFRGREPFLSIDTGEQIGDAGIGVSLESLDQLIILEELTPNDGKRIQF